MNDKQKTKARLIQELEDMRKFCAELQERVHHPENTSKGEAPLFSTPSTRRQESSNSLYPKPLQTCSNILEQTLESIVMTDLDGVIRYVNPAAEQLHGFSSEELIGKPGTIFNAEPDPAAFHREIVETVRSGGKFIREARNRRKDGSTFIVSINISPLRDKNGTVYGFLTLKRDITVTRYAEKLTIAERDLSMALNNATTLTDALKICMDAAMGISETDSGGIYLRNESGDGYDLAFHTGLAKEFVNKSLHFERDSEKGRLLNEGNPVYFNFQNINKPHALSEGLKSMAVIPIRYMNRILGSMNVGSHILEEIPKFSRVALETIASHVGSAIINAQQTEALRQSRQNYDQLFNSLKDLLFITNYDGQIVHVNEAVFKRMGYAKEEIVGQSILMIHPKEMYDEAEKVFQDMVSGREDSCIIPIQTKDGVQIPVETKVTLGLWDGQKGLYCISRDMTVHKQFEKELQESKDELASISDNSPIQIMSFDGERFLYASKSWYDYTSQEKSGLPQVDFWSSHIHPDDMENVLVTWDELWKTKVAGLIFYRFRNKLGDYHYFETRAVPVFDRAGQFKHFLGYNIDVTQRKLAEEALQKSERNYREIFNATTEAIFLHDAATGHVLDVNSAMVNMYGYDSKEEVLAGKMLDLAGNESPYTGDDAKRWFLLAVKEGPQVFEWQAKKKNGELFWVEVSLRSTQISGEGRILAVVRDITERKIVEKALQESERNYREIFNATTEAIFLQDVETGRVLDVNDAVLAMFGYVKKDEIIGGRVGEFSVSVNQPPYTKENAFRFVRLAIEEGPQVFEWLTKRKNGSLFWVEISLPKTEIGGQGRVLAVIRNINERKLAEDALQESERNYREIFNATNEAIFVHDPITRQMLDVNDAALRMFGFNAKAEMLALQIGDLMVNIPPYTPESAMRIQLDPEQNPQVFDWLVHKKDGARFWVEVSLRRTQIGGEERVLAVVRDITERKRVEALLKTERDRNANILSGTNAGTWDLDFAAGAATLNERWAEIVGKTLDELTPFSMHAFLEHIHSDDLPRVQESHGRQLRGERDYHDIEFRMHHKSGDWVWVNARGKITERDSDGRPLRMSGTILDITERKRVEEALRQSERNYREIFNATSDAIFVGDVETARMVDTNDAMLRMVGFDSKEELLAFDIWSLMANEPPYTKEEAFHYFRLAIEQGPQVFEWLSRRKNGELFWVEVSLRCSEISGQRRILAVVRDINERKQAENALKESEERFRRIFYTSPDAVIITKVEDGHIVDINHSGARIIGYDREDVVGKTSLDIRFWANPEDRQELIHRLKKTGYCENFEMRFRRKGDSVGIGLMSASMMVLQGTSYIVSITRDITEHKRVEEEIRKLSEVVRQSPVSVVIADTDGSISYVNPKFSEVTGYMLEEVKGQNPRILKSGETSEEEYKALWATITSGKVWQGRFHNKRKDGSLFWEDATIFPLFDKAGSITQFLALKEDITHNMSLEQQLRQAQKMEAIGRLAGGVAHDFNNLLLVIKGFTDLILRKLTSTSPHYEHIHQIQRAGDRAAELTRQLLAFSRKQILQPKVLDLSALLKDMEKMLRRIIGEDINLITIYEDDLYKVKADPGQIEQVILNLAVNARDAMPTGGRLTIESHNAYLDEAYVKANEGSSVGHYAMISITDTGTGIEKEIQAHIFEPFFTTKDMGKGTGLGLSTVYGIIKQSGGNIWIYSEPGAGATFKIYLPSIEDAPDTQKQPGKSKNAMRGSETILVVEDEDVVCELLKTGLEDLGYKIFKAKTGPKALELVEKHANEIRLLLTDVIMPEMSGRELADKVGALHSSIKTLFMSGYADTEIVHHGMLDEGIAFIQKPFTIPEVAKRIRSILDEK